MSILKLAQPHGARESLRHCVWPPHLGLHAWTLPQTPSPAPSPLDHDVWQQSAGQLADELGATTERAAGGIAYQGPSLGPYSSEP